MNGRCMVLHRGCSLRGSGFQWPARLARLACWGAWDSQHEEAAASAAAAHLLVTLSLEGTASARYWAASAAEEGNGNDKQQQRGKAAGKCFPMRGPCFPMRPMWTLWLLTQLVLPPRAGFATSSGLLFAASMACSLPGPFWASRHQPLQACCVACCDEPSTGSCYYRPGLRPLTIKRLH